MTSILGPIAAALVALQSAGDVPEVRQLVSFRFLPGRTGDAIEIFREQALPLYQVNEPMLRFRAFREVESPEPLDLVVVSSFRGMAGMDLSNLALSAEAKRRGSSVSEIYGRIAALSDGHRDEFVEIDRSLSWGEVDGAKLVVLLRLRPAPGRSQELERLFRERVVPWERGSGELSGSEGGRFLISDGFGFFRALGISALGDWHEYLARLREQPFARELDQWIAESRQVILAPVPELSIR